MKKKKLAFSLVVAILVVVAVGCGNGADKKTESSSSITSDSEKEAETSSTAPAVEEPIVYTAVVKQDSNSENGQVWVESLLPVDSNKETPPIFKEEVVLLTDGSNVFDGKTNEKISLDEIKAGTNLEVTLAAEPVSTMSIPPQIPGKDVHKIVVK